MDFISARLALGEALREAAMGLKCFADWVPVLTPVTALECPLAKLRAEGNKKGTLGDVGLFFLRKDLLGFGFLAIGHDLSLHRGRFFLFKAVGLLHCI